MKKCALIQRVSLLTTMHFLVDFICVFSVLFMYQTCIDWEYIVLTVLIYDCLAFLTQPLTGMLVDKHSTKKELQVLIMIAVIFAGLGVISCFENIALRLLIGYFGVFVGPVLLGLANSLFHVIGGKEILVINDKAKLGGIYVSSGAFGLGLGTFLATQLADAEMNIVSIISILSLLILITIAVLHWFLPTSNNEKDDQLNYKVVGATPIRIIILLISGICLAIGFRSLLGYAGSKESILDVPYAVLITAGCAVFGKALGGVLQDFFGPRIVIIISTVLGILSLVLPKEAALHPCIFIFSVNLLMPVTLDLIRRLLPRKEGLAFGLTAMFVLIGYLVFLPMQELTWLRILSVIITCITGVMLFIIDYHMRKKLCQM